MREACAAPDVDAPSRDIADLRVGERDRARAYIVAYVDGVVVGPLASVAHDGVRHIEDGGVPAVEQVELPPVAWPGRGRSAVGVGVATGRIVVDGREDNRGDRRPCHVHRAVDHQGRTRMELTTASGWTVRVAPAGTVASPVTT